jgi:SAM-dependent methyltransferase
MSADLSSAAVIWHDVECGGYDADLPLWEELAAGAKGPILELGCGTGRVTVHLARRGHEMIGLDRDDELLASLRERARGLPVETVAADASEFSLQRSVSLLLAPMQLLQLLPGAAERRRCLDAVAAALRPGGRFAAAIVERLPEPVASPTPIPDVRDVEGWVYSSLPVDAALVDQQIVIRRLRQTVSPAGELREERNEVRIHAVEVEQLEAEAARAGLQPIVRREIPPTELHIGSIGIVFGTEG